MYLGKVWYIIPRYAYGRTLQVLKIDKIFWTDISNNHTMEIIVFSENECMYLSIIWICECPIVGSNIWGDEIHSLTCGCFRQVTVS